MIGELRHVGSCWEVPRKLLGSDLLRFVEFARALEAAVQPTSGNDRGAEKWSLRYLLISMQGVPLDFKRGPSTVKLALGA